LVNKKIIAISCGETHTLALTDTGHLYTFGANGCGQLGQFLNEYERKRKNGYEEIVFPKANSGLLDSHQYSFMSDVNSANSSPREGSKND